MIGGQRDRGVALITAVLITTLAASAALAMTVQQQFDVRRTANLLDREQAYQFALGVEAWAMQLLARDRRDGKTDDLDEDWAEVLPPIVIDGGTVSGRIEDLQGRFNLNNLVKNGQRSAPDIARFARLLEALELDQELAQAVADWIDPDLDPEFPGGAEDGEYLAAARPYRAANAPLASPSELLAMRNVGFETYAKLEPFVAALPGYTTLNLNTAKAPVLYAAIASLSLSDAEALQEAAKESPFDGVDAALESAALAGREVSDAERALLGVASDYFLLRGVTEFGRGRIELASVVHRTDDGKVHVQLRAQGEL